MRTINFWIFDNGNAERIARKDDDSPEYNLLYIPLSRISQIRKKLQICQAALLLN